MSDPSSGVGGSVNGMGSAGRLPKGKSMFSLNSERSLRLQRWGNWIAYEDQAAKTIYWYNPSNGSGQWEKPDEVSLLSIGRRFCRCILMDFSYYQVNNLQKIMGSGAGHSASTRVRDSF
jgi:hypothetical protein